MRRRPAATLVEVLIAIFVMALGMLALLTLFPLGALTMAQAIKDDRTANAAANAAAVARILNLPQDPGLFAPNDPFSNPLPNTPTAAALPDGPSYPVFVDPAGFRGYSGVPLWSIWAGGRPGGIPRRSISFLQTPNAPPTLHNSRLLNWFSLIDDLNFLDSGLPPVPVIQRENRYSWSYLLRRPRSSTPGVTELTVVVYDRRPLYLSDMPGVGALQGQGEIAYDAQALGPNVVRLLHPGREKPALRKGGWILDDTAAASPVELLRHGPVHGHFYRVVGISEVSAGETDLELATNLRTERVASVLIMENVAEVFEKGALTGP